MKQVNIHFGFKGSFCLMAFELPHGKIRDVFKEGSLHVGERGWRECNNIRAYKVLSACVSTFL